MIFSYTITIDVIANAMLSKRNILTFLKQRMLRYIWQDRFKGVLYSNATPEDLLKFDMVFGSIIRQESY
jgi:hypothetical protein